MVGRVKTCLVNYSTTLSGIMARSPRLARRASGVHGPGASTGAWLRGKAGRVGDVVGSVRRAG